MTEIGITREEWLAGIERAEAASAEGAKTAKEWAEMAGRSVEWIREHIRRGMEAGLIEYVPVQRETISKKMVPVSAYRLKPESE